MKENTAEKLNRIQSLFDMGKTQKEIAEMMGYTDIKSFYRYIARYDASLNRKKQYNTKKLHTVPMDEKKGSRYGGYRKRSSTCISRHFKS